MARKKVHLQWIANDATRRATLKKRRCGLMKKARELSTLCDVKTCLVVYSPGEAQPEVWPSVPEATSILVRFRSMPELEQSKKMMDQEGFLRQRVAKIQEQLRKAERENHELEMEMLMHNAMTGRRPGLVGLSVEEVTSLGWIVELRLKAVMERIELLRAQAVVAPLPPLMSLPLVPQSGDVGVTAQLDEPVERQRLFTEVNGTVDLAKVFSNGFGGADGSNRGSGGGISIRMMRFSMDPMFMCPRPSTSPHM